MKTRRFCMLMILDGWGIDASGDGNAFHLAKTPNIDRLLAEYPHTRLACSGKAVGLPDGVMGNSEVGHLNIGAGRIVYQDLVRINMAIKEGSFFNNAALNSVMSKVIKNNATLHLMGLVSDGGVHSHIDHIIALTDMAREKGVGHVNIHAILDGRDTRPDSGVGYIRQLQGHIQQHGGCQIASVCGRFYAMDRDNRWERVEQAYRLYTRGDGITETDPVRAVENAYAKGETDEFVHPVIISGGDQSPARKIIRDGDGVVFFNFRADRAREITRAFTTEAFDPFERPTRPDICEYVTMTQYDETFDLPAAFPPVRLGQILGEVLSAQGVSQLRIAETEKYAHVTYFFNGGEETPFPLEDRLLIPSPREVETYDLKPEMSARPLTEEVLSRLQSGKYGFVALNFANMDMVGHTGIVKAAVSACEVVDECVGKIVSQVKAMGGTLLMTADHGNAEKMIQPNGGPHTAHTVNPVPLVLMDDTRKTARLRRGILGDIAPTVLDIMGIDKPEQMTGTSLIETE